MNIRPFQDQDLPLMMDIGNRAWTPIRAMTKEALGSTLYAQLHPYPEIEKGLQIQAHVAEHPEWAMVCEVQNQIVGFVTFAIDREQKMGEILNNAVDPAAGVKGAGQAMYSAVLNHFRDEGLSCAKVVTGLDQAHAPARRAYERAGFNKQLKEITFFQTL